MQQMDWSGWHSAYDHPESRLSVRLRAVQRCIRSALDRCPAGEVRAISMCAGQGRDLLGVLQHHPRKDDVRARLVELDEQNVTIARNLARAAALAQVETVAGD